MAVFLAQESISWEQAGYSRTYVLAAPDGSHTRGFYTLSMYAIQKTEFQPIERDQFPIRQLPVALLGRLARDDRATGDGRILLADAIKRALTAATHAGCIGVALHAANDQLAKYYEAIGFRVLRKATTHVLMFLPFSSFR